MATQVSLNDGAVASAGALAIQTNGTTQAVSISTGQVATLAQNPILTSGTANGVAYLNGSKALTTGSALVFDGTNLGLGVTPSGSWLTSFSNRVMQFGPVGSINSLSASTTNNQTFFSSNVIDQGGGTYSRIYADWITRYTQNSGKHVWQTSTTQTGAVSISNLMTLDSSGNLLVGTTSSLASFADGRIEAAAAASSYGLVLDATASSASGIGIRGNDSTTALSFFNAQSGATVGSIVINSATTSYNVTSDQRLKENIQDADSASSLIDSLQVRKFDWKVNGLHQPYGFIAQELVTVLPEAVYQPADTEEMMAVDYSKLVPMLVKEIQSLRKRLATAGI